MEQNNGSSKLGCLVTVVSFALILFIIYEVGPIVLDIVEFEEELNQVVHRAGADGWKERTTMYEMMLVARRFDFEVRREDIRVYKESNRLKVELTYRRKVSFFGAVYELELGFDSEALLGRIAGLSRPPVGGRLEFVCLSALT